MTLAEVVKEEIQSLSPEKQLEVLDFVQSLKHKGQMNKPLPDLHGIWRGVDISEEDVAELRKEAWGEYGGES